MNDFSINYGDEHPATDKCQEVPRLSFSNSRNWSDAGPGPGLTLPRAITGHTPRAAILPTGVPDTVFPVGIIILRTAYDI